MTDTTTPESARDALHVDPQEAMWRETEIGALAAKLRANDPSMRWIAEHQPVMVGYESGARAGLSAYRECYEFTRMIADLDRSDESVSDDMADVIRWARAAIETARA